MDSNSNWKRDHFLIPLIIAILGALVTFFIPRLFDRGKKISYTVEGPSTYIDSSISTVVSIKVDDKQTETLCGYKVKIWNSGDAPVLNIPILFKFTTEDPNFKIFSATHKTVPKNEFGDIPEDPGHRFAKRFIYPLLNPKDEDTLTFLTSSAVPLSVDAKSEGLTFSRDDPNKQPSWTTLVWAVVVGTFVSALLSISFKLFLKSRKPIGPGPRI